MLSVTPARGFTIVEVLITIMVLGILIAVAAPTFGEWLQNQQLRAAADAALNGLQVGRAEAIRRNGPVQVAFAPGGSGWTVSEITGGAVGATLQTRSGAEGSPNATLSATPGGATTVTFSAIGGIAANIDGSATISMLDVQNPGGGACQPAGAMRCLRVTVSGGGSLKMCDPIVTAPDPRAC